MLVDASLLHLQRNQISSGFHRQNLCNCDSAYPCDLAATRGSRFAVQPADLVLARQYRHAAGADARVAKHVVMVVHLRDGPMLLVLDPANMSGRNRMTTSRAEVPVASAAECVQVNMCKYCANSTRESALFCPIHRLYYTYQHLRWLVAAVANARTLKYCRFLLALEVRHAHAASRVHRER
eukprot:6201647-Pleurochrysis_carterae.AAC.3